jgi:acyl carrier protein
MDDLREQLQDVFCDVFGDDQLVIRPEMTAADIEGWDSMMHINLVIAIERHFGVKFATAEIAGTKSEDGNVGTLLSLISRKVAAKA